MKKIFFLIITLTTFAQVSYSFMPEDSTEGADSVTITVILRANQDMSTQDIQQQMLDNGFWKIFPPDYAEIISWNYVMGFGQIITLKIPLSNLSEFNETVQNAAWGAFSTEFYITYDYMPVWKDMKSKYR
jgi:hypothetical protein